METRPTVIRNPAADTDFDKAVDELLDSGVVEAAAFEARLREHFPNVTVHARELEGEGNATWYAYREGSWIRGS